MWLVAPFASRTSRLPRPHHVAVEHAALALAGLVRHALIRQFLLELLVTLRSRLGLFVQRELPFLAVLFQACPQLGGRPNPYLAAGVLIAAHPAAIGTLRDQPHRLDAAADLDRVHLAQDYVSLQYVTLNTCISYLALPTTARPFSRNLRDFLSKD